MELIAVLLFFAFLAWLAATADVEPRRAIRPPEHPPGWTYEVKRKVTKRKKVKK